ncbi:MAG: TRL domain-containing protein [Thermodesulfobacteriota bacterium]
MAGARENAKRLRFKIRWRSALVLCLLLLAAVSACALVPDASDYTLRGMIVKKVRRPLTVHLNNTPAPGPDAPLGKGKIIKIKEPFSSVRVYVELNSTAIGDVARKNGMTTVYFADIETFSILGIWNTTTIYIYGE